MTHFEINTSLSLTCITPAHIRVVLHVPTHWGKSNAKTKPNPAPVDSKLCRNEIACVISNTDVSEMPALHYLYIE